MNAFVLQPLALFSSSLLKRGLTVQDRAVQPAPRVESRPQSTPPPLDARWFAEFARVHEAALHAKALRLCGNASDARDLVQQTLERGFLNRTRYQQGTDGRAWLLTILHRIFIDTCRSRARERRADVSAEDMEERVAAPEPEEAPAWANVTIEQLRAAVEQLPEGYRAVYRMHSLENRSYQEIAEQLGIPKATVGTRLLRARRQLKEILMPTPPGEVEGT